MINQQLVEKIKIARDAGKTKEEVFLEFLPQGYRVDDLVDAYSAVALVEDKDEMQKRTIRVMVLIGAILIGAGVFSFVAANWEDMSKAMKVAVIVISMLLSYGIGWYLKENKGLVKTGDALILLGAIIYGAGIFLIGQMFHVRAAWPDGFVLWMLGTLAVGWALDSFLLYVLAVPLGIIAIFGHPIDLLENMKLDSFVMSSILLLIVATGTTLWVGINFRKKIPQDLNILN